MTIGGLINPMLNDLGGNQVTGLFNDESLLRDRRDDSKRFIPALNCYALSTSICSHTMSNLETEMTHQAKCNFK